MLSGEGNIKKCLPSILKYSYCLLVLQQASNEDLRAGKGLSTSERFVN